jgi:predicted NAD-dependent protein-ADP-ribosyltransferase YbiA (DUF1768 family)
MDRCSYFIEDISLFGSYPTQEFADHLQGMGIEYFVDLTEDSDKNIVKYQLGGDTKKINYPIRDKDIPDNTRTFSGFILTLMEIIRNKKKLYVHCRGGHGRSGIVVACLIKLYYDIDVGKALDLTYECHQKRRVMRDRWRQLGSPQTVAQKKFVKDLFDQVYYNNYNIDNNYMSNFYTAPMLVDIGGKGVRFYNVDACYQAFKAETDSEYVNMMANEINPRRAKMAGLKNIGLEWYSRREIIMDKIMFEKFKQNPELRSKLLFTGLGEIVKISKRTSFWNSIHYNRTGVILTKIRNEFYLSERSCAS